MTAHQYRWLPDGRPSRILQLHRILPARAIALLTNGSDVTINVPPQRGTNSTAAGSNERPLKSVLLLLCSSMFLACSDAMAKFLAKDLHPAEIGWIRFSVFVLIMVPVVMSHGTPILRSSRVGLQLARGVALVLSSLLFVAGLAYLPIAEATATAFISPLLVTALSIVFLGEVVGIRRWLATIIGLLGVLIIVRPGTSAFQTAAIFPILSALAWAFTIILTRMMSGRDKPETTMVYAAVVGFVTLSCVVPFVWVTPTTTQLLVAICIGFMSTAGHWLVILAYRHSDASTLAPFTYSTLLWVTALGYLAFSEVPDVYTTVGASVIIASGIYTANRERIRKKGARDAVEPIGGV